MVLNLSLCHEITKKTAKIAMKIKKTQVFCLIENRVNFVKSPYLFAIQW